MDASRIMFALLANMGSCSEHVIYKCGSYLDHMRINSTDHMFWPYVKCEAMSEAFLPSLRMMQWLKPVWLCVDHVKIMWRSCAVYVLIICEWCLDNNSIICSNHVYPMCKLCVDHPLIMPKTDIMWTMWYFTSSYMLSPVRLSGDREFSMR